jgi:hypothetical protein
LIYFLQRLTPDASRSGRPAKEKAMTKNTTVTLDEAVANSAALAEQWASSCRK